MPASATREIPVSRIDGGRVGKGGSLVIVEAWRYPPEDPVTIDDPSGAFPRFMAVEGQVHLRNHPEISMVPVAGIREL